ncbi:MAG: hypothetical protein R3195_05420 [Gemmatimonadota bacterium]|nr:hypothetical protein [Gemmatimonadota bacterium]
MRPIDVLAFGLALLSLLSFVSSSTSFRVGRATLGTLKLLMGAAALVLGVSAGVASVGTDGYRPLTSEPALVARATIGSIDADSVSARVTWPDGITRTFRLGGRSVRFDVRVLRWQIGGAIVGAPRSWELSGLRGEYRGGEAPVGSVRDLQVVKPVTVYDLVLKYPALRSIVGIEQLSVELPVGADEAEIRISNNGLAVVN